MLFRKGTDIVAPDGEKVGELDRVVIDPASKEVTHIAVAQGLLFPADKVVPISLIEAATEKEIRLRQDADGLEELPDLVEAHYVEAEGAAGKKEELAGELYWYPPTSTLWWAPRGYLGYPGHFGYPMPPYVVETEINVPEDKVALDVGAPVISSDGAHVGAVEEVMTDPLAERATHLLITRGLILKEQKLIPTLWIAEVLGDRIRLAVGTDFIQDLPSYEPAD
jgi:uncharacterized protein YrrD